jgi:predicted small secreted protein
MNLKRFFYLVSVLVVLSMVLAACAPKTTTGANSHSCSTDPHPCAGVWRTGGFGRL